MFIKISIYNYNVEELLLVASRLAFALDAWVALILIMELIVVLLLVEKENATKKFQPIVLGLHDYIYTCSTNNYDAIPHHSWLPFSHEPTIEHRPSYNSHFLDLLQHHFWPFPSK
jgi:hypothetical protein